MRDVYEGKKNHGNKSLYDLFAALTLPAGGRIALDQKPELDMPYQYGPDLKAMHDSLRFS